MSNPVRKEFDNKDNLSLKKKPYRDRDDKPRLPPKEQLDIISQFFINNASGRYNLYEMEAKFGTRGIKHITKMDYDNVVKKLKSLGFVSDNVEGTYSLKIQPEFLDIKTGEFKTSGDFDRFRIDIGAMAIDDAHNFCYSRIL